MSTLNLIFKSPRSHLALVDTAWNIKIGYEELEHQVRDVGVQLLSFGDIQRGDCVSLIAHNSLEFVASFLGIACLSCTAAPLNPNFTSAEFEFYLKDSCSKIAIVQESLLENNPDHSILKAAKAVNVFLILLKRGLNGIQLFPIGSFNTKSVPRDLSSFKPKSQDTCLLLHTSGTTGRPKAVPLCHQNICKSMQNIVQTYQLSEADTTYLVMPLFHVHGLIGALLSTLLSGGTVVIPPKFSASNFWKEYRTFNCTWYTAVPTIHQILLNLEPPPKNTTIRFIRSCSSSLAPVIFQQLEKKIRCTCFRSLCHDRSCSSNDIKPTSACGP